MEAHQRDEGAAMAIYTTHHRKPLNIEMPGTASA